MPSTLTAPNYTFATGTSATFTINQAELKLNAVANSKTYGNADPTFGYTLGGFKFSDTATTSGITGVGSCSRSNPLVEAAGTYSNVITCVPNTLTAPNYTFATGTSATFTINQAELKLNAVANSKTYGNADPTFGYTLGGFKFSDTATTSGISGVGSCSRSNPLVEAAGTYSNVITCVPNTLTAPELHVRHRHLGHVHHQSGRAQAQRGRELEDLWQRRSDFRLHPRWVQVQRHSHDLGDHRQSGAARAATRSSRQPGPIRRHHLRAGHAGRARTTRSPPAPRPRSPSDQGRLDDHS